MHPASDPKALDHLQNNPLEVLGWNFPALPVFLRVVLHRRNHHRNIQNQDLLPA
jgi:hypothetical protein